MKKQFEDMNDALLEIQSLEMKRKELRNMLSELSRLDQMGIPRDLPSYREVLKKVEEMLLTH